MLIVCLLMVQPGLVAPGAQADEPTPDRRFLLVYSQDSALPANVEATQGVKAVLDAALGAGYEIFTEYRDAERFPGTEEDRLFANELHRKYSGTLFTGVLAFGEAALRMLLAHRDRIAPGVSISFGGLSLETLSRITLPEDVHGVVAPFSVRAALALARRLQPDAQRTVVMTGSSTFDRRWEARARQELADVTDIPIDYVSGLTIDGFVDAAARMGPRTILIILTIYEDAAGGRFTPVKAAELIAERSTAPIYTVYDTYVGRGAVGGSVATFSAIGETMAELALDLADGEPVSELSRNVPPGILVDWRKLEASGIDPSLLPVDAELLNYDPSAWERYRPQILLVAGIILLQTGMIVALVVQRRDRRRAERELTERRVEVAHMSRAVQLGELSGAIAHELNQPLTSILANAEAGRRLLARDDPDLEEIATVLAEIAEDDRRAATIIDDVRRLMTKGDVEIEPLELNDVIATAVRLAKSEMLMRSVEIEVRRTEERLPVLGNRAQLKQLVLNLLFNAADAMADRPSTRRRITVTTGRRGDGRAEVAIRDYGHGLAPELAGDPFRPFTTTKAHGLGLGLSICRTIAQAHRGTLEFDGQVDEGARVVLELPSI